MHVFILLKAEKKLYIESCCLQYTFIYCMFSCRLNYQMVKRGAPHASVAPILFVVQLAVVDNYTEYSNAILWLIITIISKKKYIVVINFDTYSWS